MILQQRIRCMAQMCFKKIFLLALFTIAAIVSLASPAWSQSRSVSGKLLEIKPLDAQSFEITVQTAKSKTKYILDSSTIIESKIPAENAKIGQRILVENASAKGIKPEETLKQQTTETTKESKTLEMKPAAAKNLTGPAFPRPPPPAPPQAPSGLSQRPSNPPPPPPASFDNPFPPMPVAHAGGKPGAENTSEGSEPSTRAENQAASQPGDTGGRKKKTDPKDEVPEDTNDALNFLGKTTQLEAVPGKEPPPKETKANSE